MEHILGVDISEYQQGIDFTLLMEEGARFAILRGGDGGYKDKCFDGFYAEAKERELPVGAYWFSRATTQRAAREEALDFYSRCLAGRQFELPVYMDVEAEKLKALGADALGGVIQAWCDTLRERDFCVGVYTNTNWLQNHLDFDALHGIELWIAQWSVREPTRAHGMWQFGGETNLLRSNTMAGRVVDQNYMRVDYPARIRASGYNGFEKEEEQMQAPVRYHSLEEVPSWAKQELEALVRSGALRGDEKGDLNLSEDMLRTLLVAKRYADGLTSR